MVKIVSGFSATSVYKIYSFHGMLEESTDSDVGIREPIIRQIITKTTAVWVQVIGIDFDFFGPFDRHK